MESILDKFPKVRIPLPEDYQKIYTEHYVLNRGGGYKTTSVSQKLEAWMHKIVASDLVGTYSRVTTLEIGAGTLNQLKYEDDARTRVTRAVLQNYDIVEPFDELYERSPLLNKVRNVYEGVEDVPNYKQYDRIISIAVFEHIEDLPHMVVKIIPLLANNGHLRVAIPNEGSFLWKLGTKITGFEFKRKYGLDYQKLMRHEHVNTANDVEGVLKYFFKTIDTSFYGVSQRLSLYKFYDCSNPNLKAVKTYLLRKECH